MAKELSLSDWINSKSVKTVANQFEVEESTVRHWRNGHSLPKASQMRAIVKASRGRVTYETMIEGFFKKQAGKDSI